MHFELRQVRHILAVSEQKSFSKAAELLGLTQPALSRSVAAFEQACGAPIFDRLKGGIQPTTLGLAVIADCEAILAQADRLARDVKSRADATIGSISLGFGPLVAALLLPGLLARIANDHPRITVRTTMDTGDGLLDALARGRIEMAVVAKGLLPASNDLRIETIGSYELGFLVRAGHPLAGRRGLSIADLGRYPIASGGWPKDRAPSPHPAAPQVTIASDNYAALEEATLASDIVWLSSPQMIGRDRRAGFALLDVVGWQDTEQPICVVRPAGRSLSPIAKTISDIMRQKAISRANAATS